VNDVAGWGSPSPSLTATVGSAARDEAHYQRILLGTGLSQALHSDGVEAESLLYLESGFVDTDGWGWLITILGRVRVRAARTDLWSPMSRPACRKGITSQSAITRCRSVPSWPPAPRIAPFIVQPVPPSTLPV